MTKENKEAGSSSRELKVIGAGLSRTGTLSTRYRKLERKHFQQGIILG